MKTLRDFYIVDTKNKKTNIDWEGIDSEYEWFRKLRGGFITENMKNKGECWLQDEYYHAEGSVWIHTKMVCNELIEMEDFYDLSKREQFVVLSAAILHDVCKPETYEKINGRISNKKHSTMGANETRNILWKQGIDFSIREEICNIIEVHQLPFYLLESNEQKIKYNIIKNSLNLSNKLLCLLAEADIKGRIIKDEGMNTKENALINIELYREYSKELKCFDSPYVFENLHTKRQYFIDYNNKNPENALFNTLDDNFVVYLLSGLPASGKTTFCENKDIPVVELDTIRKEMNIKQTDNQGKVRQEGNKRAKELLAQKKSFIWSGTNLDKNRRSLLIDLFCSYGAKVIIVYLETTCEKLQERNNKRNDNKVPDSILHKMRKQWTVPQRHESHEILYIVT